MAYKIYSGNDQFLLEEAEFSAFRASYRVIQAAGGIVRDELDRILFIFRRGKWDLPKGKLDEGETILECAKREVEEECGILVSTVTGFACTTYHLYEERGQKILKETFWYFMNASNQQQLLPQLEEDITSIEWMAVDDLQKVLSDTYPLIADIITSMNQKPL